MDDSWKRDLTPEMFGDSLYCTIAEEIGPDNLLKLSRIVGGSLFYVPIEDRLLRSLRNKKIIEEYNGYNSKELAKKYGITPRMVRYIVTRSAADISQLNQKMEDKKK